MSPSTLRRPWQVLALLASLAPTALAQVPTEIRVRHRAGQSFLTWRELPASGVRYRVYRATSALRTAQDLKNAELLGEVDERSSRNQARSLASGNEHTWIIAPEGAPLDADEGLFVHTVERRASNAYYAVTPVQGGLEERTVVAGGNATRFGVKEMPAPPQPVLQASSAEGELWGHWVGDRDTPFQPALAPWPSRGFNFQFQPGSAPGPHGLVVCLHAAGQQYPQAWPQRFETPADVDRLAVSDLVPYTSWTFWFGSHERLPSAPSSSTRVWNYTQQRVAWTLDWLTARLGAAHDPERVYVTGGSMGAIGGMLLLQEYPERFAAALLRNGLYDLEATDYRNPAMFERLLGAFALGLHTRDGLPVLTRTNAAAMAALDPTRDWPLVRTLNGRNDETVGWMSAVQLFESLARVGRPAVHYFDERTHNPDGYWRGLERKLLARTFQTRRDRPSLRFGACTLDDDPGDGARTDGDPVGTLNGYVDYDPRTAAASATRLDFDVYVRDEGALDDAPRPRALATLAPWRTGTFAPAPGEAVHYTLRDGPLLVDEHLLLADAFGRVRTPPVPLATRARTCRFERGTPATAAPLFLGGAPLAGDALQVVVRGAAGEPWTLFLALGDAAGPRAGLRFFVQSGMLPASGAVDLALPLPRFVPAGAHLWAAARLAGGLTPVQSVVVQDGEGWGPQHLRRR